MKNRLRQFRNIMYAHHVIDHLEHHISMHKKAIALFHKTDIFNNGKNSRLEFKQKLEGTLLHTLASTSRAIYQVDF